MFARNVPDAKLGHRPAAGVPDPAQAVPHDAAARARHPLPRRPRPARGPPARHPRVLRRPRGLDPRRLPLLLLDRPQGPAERERGPAGPRLLLRRPRRRSSTSSRRTPSRATCATGCSRTGTPARCWTGSARTSWSTTPTTTGRTCSTCSSRSSPSASRPGSTATCRSPSGCGPRCCAPGAATTSLRLAEVDRTTRATAHATALEWDDQGRLLVTAEAALSIAGEPARYVPGPDGAAALGAAARAAGRRRHARGARRRPRRRRGLDGRAGARPRRQHRRLAARRRPRAAARRAAPGARAARPAHRPARSPARAAVASWASTAPAPAGPSPSSCASATRCSPPPGRPGRSVGGCSRWVAAGTARSSSPPRRRRSPRHRRPRPRRRPGGGSPAGSAGGCAGCPPHGRKADPARSSAPSVAGIRPERTAATSRAWSASVWSAYARAKRPKASPSLSPLPA